MATLLREKKFTDSNWSLSEQKRAIRYLFLFYAVFARPTCSMPAYININELHYQ